MGFPKRHVQTILSALMVMVLGVGCKEEKATPVVDAMVDAGPECDPSAGGQALCKERYGERFFCAEDGSCLEIAACETEDCCAPGEMGDTYCLETYGPGSTCVAGESQGLCSARACVDCTPDDDGHACCYDALGSSWFCGGDGRCAEVTDCESEDCCVPGPGGDAKCRRNFGEASSCTQLGMGGQCLRSTPPPCAGCRPDNEGHLCCQSEFSADWFCGLEGICRQASGCGNPDCCVPGAAGDAQCAKGFGMMSACQVTDGDGRCSPAAPPE